jgi:prephenate dehydrogenase
MHLQKFQYFLMKRDGKEPQRIMKDANRIREVLNGIEYKQVKQVEEK